MFVYDGREEQQKVEEWKVKRQMKEQEVNLFATVLAKKFQDRNKGLEIRVYGENAIAEDSPVCLLGRDLLQTLDIEIRLAPEGIDFIVTEMNVIEEKNVRRYNQKWFWNTLRIEKSHKDIVKLDEHRCGTTEVGTARVEKNNEVIEDP